MNAQHLGAAAALIYSDPHEDGYAQGEVYPAGPWRPKSGVQRGSIQFISVCAGDPERAYMPHGLNASQVCGKTREELIPSIPVLPLSWGDALAYLEALDGPEAPPSFRGALNITYRMGPSKDGLKAQLSVHNRFQRSPVWNVIATIPGTLQGSEDQPVILGNHRDAWVFGAADPNSGTAQLIEVAIGLGKLLKAGWRPLRSIILTSWSGEEYGLLGSTAWGEVHGDGVDGQRSAAARLANVSAYINVDTGVSGRSFGASGTASLGGVLQEVLAHVKDPATGKPLSALWGGELYALGSGSDYTVFIDHLGIPSVDMHFSPEAATYGVYHSVYDSFEWMDSVGDPGFHYHRAMSQLWGLLAMRLSGTASAPVLRLNVTHAAEAIQGYIRSAMQLLNGTKDVDFSSLLSASAAFTTAATQVMSEVKALQHTPSLSADQGKTQAVLSLNRKLGLVERVFLTTEGLPGRKWFRHPLQAPGLYTGYAAQTLPGIEHALTTYDYKEAQEQVEVAAGRVQAAAEFLAVD